MCEHGELVWMPELGPHGLFIDKCMEEFIKDMNNDGLKTLACCCGHGKYKRTVVVQHNDLIYEWISGIPIERIRRFYKTDKDGLYYIPEVEHE